MNSKKQKRETQNNKTKQYGVKIHKKRTKIEKRKQIKKRKKRYKRNAMDDVVDIHKHYKNSAQFL